MRDLRAYNLIFPIWLLIFFPPVTFIALIGNYIIDSIVIIACFYWIKGVKDQFGLKVFYKRSIIGVWLFGFFADIIGAVFLFVVLMAGNSLGMPHEIDYAISYDPFSQPIAVFTILFAIMISSALIFFLNYRYTFQKVIEDKKIRLKVALTIAIVTMPWTFLIPTKWFFME